MTPIWHITLLSHLEIQRGDEPPIRMARHKSSFLLAYLGCFAHKPHTREHLAETLWGEAETEAGTDTRRDNMRSALRELRRKMDAPGVPLHQSVIVGGRDDLRLNGAQVTCDAALYREKMQQAKRTRNEEARICLLEQAVELYRGDLLSTLDDDWIVAERRILAEEQRSALSQLTGWYERAGNIGKAIAYAQQTAHLDQRDETACCHLMRLHIRCGQYAEAQAQYARLRRVLKLEWEEDQEDNGNDGEAGIYAPAPSEEACGLNHQAGERLRASGHVLKSANGWNFRPAPRQIRVTRPCCVPARHPAHLTRYFDQHGRIAALADALRADSSARLVTLVGLGGAGKTRLAAETARTLQTASDGLPGVFQNHFQSRVFWIDLTPLRDAAQIADAISDAILPRRDAELPVLDQLARDMGGERALLVLDNFEHLAERGASVVRDLLHRLPLLSILVTSRQRLRIQGEQTRPLSLLTPPDSIDLFADRARLAQPAFTLEALDAANRNMVEELCRRLEGIPLALELAAAWMDTLAPTDILAGLEHRFDLLVSAHDDVPARHRSLHALIAWSYEQLPDALATLFVRLSVFRGGWNAQAAQAVCEEQEESSCLPGFPAAALHALRLLQEKSLILAREGQTAELGAKGETRFHLLETLREFADSRLSEVERAGCAKRHAAYFLRLAEQAEEGLRGAEQTAWLDRLETDHDNLRAALEYLHQTGQTHLHQRLVSALARFWQLRGHISEGRQRLACALAACPEPTPARAQMLRYAGNLADAQSDRPAAAALFTESLTTARHIHDESLTAWALYALGHNSLAMEAFAEARSYLMESMQRFALLDELDGQRGAAFVQHKLGSVSLAQGDFDRAICYFERAADLHGELGDLHSQALSLLNIGNARVNQGKVTEAGAWYARSLAVFKATGDVNLVAVAQACLGNMAIRTGRYSDAQTLLERALKTHRELGARVHEAWSLYFLGTLALKQNHTIQARECYEESLKILQGSGNRARVAVLLLAFGHLAQMEGETARAARLFGASAALFTRINTTIDPAIHSHHALALDATRATLGEAAFAVHWAEGQTYAPEQTVTYALYS